MNRFQAQRIKGWVIGLLACVCLGVVAEDFDRVYDKPVPVRYRNLAGDIFQQRAVGHDRAAFRVQTAEGSAESVSWDSLAPEMAQHVLKKIVARRDAVGWLEAGLILRDVEAATPAELEQKKPSDQAFDLALRLDADLAQRIAVARGDAVAEIVGDLQSDEAAEGDHEHEGDSAFGTATPWPILTEAEKEELTQQELAWSQGHLDAVGVDYHLVLSEHFAMLSDKSLGKNDTRKTSKLLEAMYDELLLMFDLDRDAQVYAGRCIVVVLRTREDFRAYEQAAHGYDARSAAGVCHYRPNGTVQIVARRSDDEWFFRKLVVHENVHGFLHRYRTPQRIATWINEGLAEHIAYRIVPQSTARQSRRQAAHKEFYQDNHQQIAEIFESWPGGQWAYGLACGLTDFMIEGDRLAYRDLIHDIKAGRSWQDALQQRFNLDAAKLLRAYAEANRLPMPRP